MAVTEALADNSAEEKAESPRKEAAEGEDHKATNDRVAKNHGHPPAAGHTPMQ